MSVQHIRSDNEFNALMRDCASSLLLVDFFAEWCGPCKMIAPVVESLAAKYKQLRVAKVDVDQCRATSQACGVQAMPTFHLYLRGNKVGEMRGADASGLQQLVAKHISSAPSPAFSGSGNVLGSSPNPNPNPNPSPSPSANPSAPNQAVLDTLLAMGFPEAAARTAAQSTGDVETAVEMCVSLAEGGAGASPSADSNSPSADNHSLSAAPNHSLSAPAPLTEEDRRAALARVEERRRELAAAKQAEELRLTQERERKRVLDGKKMLETKEQLQETARNRELEAKKMEQEADRRRRERVRQQIEEDKAERAARQRQSGAASASASASASAASASTVQNSTLGSNLGGGKGEKVYEQCLIQVKDAEGRALQATFAPGDALRVVREWVVAETGRKDARLAQTFPRKIYTEAELDQYTLQDARLVPRGALLLL